MKYIQIKDDLIIIVDGEGKIRFAFKKEHVVTIEPSVMIRGELDLRITFVNEERRSFFNDTAKELMDIFFGVSNA